MEKSVPIKLKKTKNNYLLFFGEEKLVVTEEIVIKYRLFNKKVILDSEISILKKENILAIEYLKIVKLLLRTRKTEKEIILRLQKKGISHEEIIAKLKFLKLLDDDKYFNLLSENLFSRGKGPKYIKQKLLLKGCQEEKISDLLKKFNFDDAVKKFCQKNQFKFKDEPVLRQKQKLFALGLRNGFSLDSLTSFINKLTLIDDSFVYLKKRLFLEFDENDKNKIIKKYMRKGFSYESVIKIIEEIKDEKNK